MRRTLPFLIALSSLAAAGCPNGGDPPPPDASCSMEIALGSGSVDDFVPATSGDTAEVVLGFQGFRMLVYTLRMEGAPDSRAEVSGYVTIPDTGLEVSQLPRSVPLREGPDGARYVEELLLFFNETPVSEIVGRDADLELVARSGDCLGTLALRVALRDDDDCVDYGVEIDAGAVDAGVPDGSVACEGAP